MGMLKKWTVCPNLTGDAVGKEVNYPTNERDVQDSDKAYTADFPITMGEVSVLNRSAIH